MSAAVPLQNEPPKNPLPANEDQAAALAQNPDQRYFPASDEKQLTPRALIVGCLIGGMMSCLNIYIGLRIGWTFGASIIAAVLGYAFFLVLGKKLSVLETNITQTSASAAGGMASAAGLVAAIPAMEMLGYEIAPSSLLIWAVAVAFLGVFFAVPLRRQMVEIDNLRFPTGTATSETILAMFSDGSEALLKSKTLLVTGGLAAFYTLGMHFTPVLEHPSLLGLDALFGIGVFALAAKWTFSLYLGPALFGGGFLIGPRIGFSLLLGAVVAWAFLGPWAQALGVAPGAVMSYKEGARGWLLWPGVALMVSEALMSLALSWRTFMRALRVPTRLGDGASDREGIPNLWWLGGLAAGSVLTVTLAYWVFDIHPVLSVIAIALSSVLAIVATRSVGETDINPIGGMGKVTQLAFGGLAPGAMSTNLMAAAITGAGAAQAADMMQDLKTGRLLGASPRKQFFAQLIGIAAGVFFCVPAYMLFKSAYEIGGEKMPAPAAHAWRAMAEVLAKGFEALPPGALEIAFIALCAGALLPVLRRINVIKTWVPSGLAMGIAFIIPAFYSLALFLGVAVWMVWRAVSPSSNKKLDFAVASGLLVGESLMGILNAGLTIGGIDGAWVGSVLFSVASFFGVAGG